MTLRLPLLALALACGPALAEDTLAPEIAFFDAGILCAPNAIGEREAPDTVAGTTHVVEDAPPFVSDGRIVPAVIGVGFGVRAAVAGDGGLNGVTISFTHPAMPGSGATNQSFESYVGPASDPGLAFYQFDYDYELVTGDWTMEASYDGYTLFRTTFTVVPPGALPELADACGYVDLLG